MLAFCCEDGNQRLSQQHGQHGFLEARHHDSSCCPYGNQQLSPAVPSWGLSVAAAPSNLYSPPRGLMYLCFDLTLMV
jgi:hypothetical protein